MKDKHIRSRVSQCLIIAENSNCPRRKFGAILFDPIRNVDLCSGYNGGPRGGSDLCGDGVCLREAQNVKSGTQIEIGCHHAEMNVICNAAANGVRSDGAWLIVTGEPCMMCAKLLHHAGIRKVLVVKDGYAGANGVEYLRKHGVDVEAVDGPKDPRLPVATPPLHGPRGNDCPDCGIDHDNPPEIAIAELCLCLKPSGRHASDCGAQVLRVCGAAARRASGWRNWP